MELGGSSMKSYLVMAVFVLIVLYVAMHVDAIREFLELPPPSA